MDLFTDFYIQGTSKGCDFKENDSDVKEEDTVLRAEDVDRDEVFRALQDLFRLQDMDEVEQFILVIKRY